MQQALRQARLAFARGEVPIGAVVMNPHSEEVVSSSGNRVVELKDPTAHAEFLALRDASRRLGASRLLGLELYTTLEPCCFCAAAIALFRVERLYFGAYDPKGGGVVHGACVFGRNTTHHRPHIVGGLLEEECADLLRLFFARLRDRQSDDVRS